MKDMNEAKPSAYDAMADAVKASMDQLLIPFHVASDPQGPLQDMTTEAFFERFLVYADKFTGQCCQDFSKILRQASLVPEVRGTPTLQLAKQIREMVFEAPDKILVSYVDTLKQIHMDLNGIASSFSESSVVGEAMKGAAIGRVAGGFGGSGKVLGAVGAIAAAGNEAMKQAVLLAQQKRLEAEAKSLAFSKILEYLKAVEELPENLLDYGCARCFGGQIDFSKQTQAVEQSQVSLKEKLEEALTFTLQIQQHEQERVLKAAADETAARQKKSGQSKRNGNGVGLVVVGIMLLMAAVSQPAGNSDSAVICFMLGVPSLGAGIFLLRKKPQEGTGKSKE